MNNSRPTRSKFLIKSFYLVKNLLRTSSHKSFRKGAIFFRRFTQLFEFETFLLRKSAGIGIFLSFIGG
jgi:hypothetical protein